MRFEYLVNSLTDTLSYVKGDSARDTAEHLLEKYGSVDRIMAADTNVHTDDVAVGGTAALYIKLVASVISRMGTEKYKFGVTHSTQQTDEYLKALFLPCSVECVYALTYDKRGRALACDLISEGVVNSSELLPRKIVEVATRRRAAYMIIAHNHPLGVASPSDADVAATMSIARILSNSGVSLVRHVIVSGNEITSIPVNMQAK